MYCWQSGGYFLANSLQEQAKRRGLLLRGIEGIADLYVLARSNAQTIYVRDNISPLDVIANANATTNNGKLQASESAGSGRPGIPTANDERTQETSTTTQKIRQAKKTQIY